MESLKEWKNLRRAFQYQREFEKSFEEYEIKIIEKIKEIYGIDTNSQKTSKKKI